MQFEAVRLGLANADLDRLVSPFPPLADAPSDDDPPDPPADVIDSATRRQIRLALERVEAEEAAWFVAEEGTTKVGMVFGELIHGEVNVRIWIHPDYRKRGYGTAALRGCFVFATAITSRPAIP